MSAEIPLWLLVGLPGSGKSTWAQGFVGTHPGYRWVSTDAIRAQLYGDAAIQGEWLQVWGQVQRAWQESISAISQRRQWGVIYDATNVRRRHRRGAITTARQLGFTHVSIYWLDVPLEVCLARNRLRSRQVPENIIQAMHRQLQGAPPSLGEGADMIVRWSNIRSRP